MTWSAISMCPTIPAWPPKITLRPVLTEPAIPVWDADGLSGADSGIVADLHKIVDLCPVANSRCFKTRSIDCRISSYFDIIFNDDNAELLEFCMFPFGICAKTKAARTDDSAGLDDDSVSNQAAL